MVNKCCEKTLGILFHYETLKIVDIKNKKVGLMFRLIQSVILAYVIGYVIIYKKGYQERDTAISTVSTKLKGTAYVDFKNFSSLFNGIQVYDSSDYVIPPQEQNGFFVMTNMIITPTQMQGKCPEDTKFRDNWCTEDKDCDPPLEVVKNGNGVRTGKCVDSDKRPGIKVCEIYGWCPTEIDKLPMPSNNFSESIPLLDLAKDFTVLVKNHVNFAKFRITRQNIIGYKKRSDLKKCTYNKETNPTCPIFRLGDILTYCGDNFTEVGYKGGIYGILVNWDCNFDYNIDSCVPVYDFTRLDDPDAPISPGYNFRYSDYFVENSKRYRTLTKAYGIKFQVLVNAKAGKFGPVPLFLNLGAGFALLGLAKICCDFLVLYCLKKRKVYKQYKFDSVNDDCKRDDELNATEVGSEEEEEDNSCQCQQPMISKQQR